MDDKLLRFFDQMPEALPLYQKFEREVLSRVEDVHIKVQKTQITYSNRHVFACVSFFLSASARPMPNPRPSPRLPLDSSIPISSCITG